MDIQKPFDKHPYKKLLRKLGNHKVRGKVLSWYKKNGYKWVWNKWPILVGKEINNEVPQRSGLRTIFFNAALITWG